MCVWPPSAAAAEAWRQRARGKDVGEGLGRANARDTDGARRVRDGRCHGAPRQAVRREGCGEAGRLVFSSLRR